MKKNYLLLALFLGVFCLLYSQSSSAYIVNATRWTASFSNDTNTTTIAGGTAFGANNLTIVNNCTNGLWSINHQALTINATKLTCTWTSNVTSATEINASLNAGTNFINNITSGTAHNFDYAFATTASQLYVRARLGTANECVALSSLTCKWDVNLTRTNTTPSQVIQNTNSDKVIIDVNYTASSGETITYTLNDTSSLGRANINSGTGVVNGSANVSNAGTYHFTAQAQSGETVASTTFTYTLNNTAPRGVYNNLTPGGEQALSSVLTCDVGGTDDDLNSVAYTWYRWYGNDAVVGASSGRTYTANTPNEVVHCEGTLFDGNLNSTAVNSSDTRISGNTGGGGGGSPGFVPPTVNEPARVITETPTTTIPSAPSQGSQVVVNVLNQLISAVTGIITGLINALTSAISGR